MFANKPGVKYHPSYAIALMTLAVERVCTQFGITCVVTSGCEGQHKPGSLHESGRALDFRTSSIPAERLAELHGRVRDALGGEFDVILEADHLHVEWDPT